jgi:hypothetical protein
MLILRDPASSRLIADPEVRKLVDLRFAQVFAGEEYAPDLHGYALVFVLNDDGYGIEILVPKADGVDRELLAMCAQFAVPAPDIASP